MNGHGPLQNVLDNYTLDNVNGFIREIDREKRLEFKELITATRVAGAEQKSYDRYMGHLRQRERMEAAAEAKREKRPMILTPKEREALDAQQHVRFTELPAEEQALRDSMWSQIPPHLREKANKMAGR